MGILDHLPRLDRAADARARGARKNVPGHLLAMGIGIVLMLLSIGAALSGEPEPANLMLGMGIGTSFGAAVVALSVRRAARSSGT